MPGVDFTHAVRVGRRAGLQYRTDLPHEGQGRFRWRPDSQTRACSGCGLLKLCRWPRGAVNMEPATASCGWPSPATSSRPRSTQIPSSNWSRACDRASETGRDGDLHRGKSRGLVVFARQHVHLLASVGEAGSFTLVDQHRHDAGLSLASARPAGAPSRMHSFRRCEYALLVCLSGSRYGG
jgi:hypothetical protein